MIAAAVVGVWSEKPVYPWDFFPATKPKEKEQTVKEAIRAAEAFFARRERKPK